jgi:hypothetical protein
MLGGFAFISIVPDHSPEEFAFLRMFFAVSALFLLTAAFL